MNSNTENYIVRTLFYDDDIALPEINHYIVSNYLIPYENALRQFRPIRLELHLSFHYVIHIETNYVLDIAGVGERKILDSDSKPITIYHDYSDYIDPNGGISFKNCCCKSKRFSEILDELLSPIATLDSNPKSICVTAKEYVRYSWSDMRPQPVPLKIPSIIVYSCQDKNFFFEPSVKIKRGTYKSAEECLKVHKIRTIKFKK